MIISGFVQVLSRLISVVLTRCAEVALGRGVARRGTRVGVVWISEATRWRLLKREWETEHGNSRGGRHALLQNLTDRRREEEMEGMKTDIPKK